MDKNFKPRNYMDPRAGGPNVGNMALAQALMGYANQQPDAMQQYMPLMGAPNAPVMPAMSAEDAVAAWYRQNGAPMGIPQQQENAASFLDMAARRGSTFR